MSYRGKARKLGAHVDTDAIIPAKYLVTTDLDELGKHCMAGLDSEWIKRIDSGDMIVAGPNFGCGSSREHAPLAILGAGISVVIAHSFARIFYRNALNMGLPLLELGEDVNRIDDGDSLEVNLEKGEIKNQASGQVLLAPPLPDFMQRIVNSGGLIQYVRNRLEKR